MAMFLTPALTALIGRAAWWPGHIDNADPSSHPVCVDEEPVLDEVAAR